MRYWRAIGLSVACMMLFLPFRWAPALAVLMAFLFALLKGSRKNNLRFSHPICTPASTRPQSQNPQRRPGYASDSAQSPKPNLWHIWARKPGSYFCASPQYQSVVRLGFRLGILLGILFSASLAGGFVMYSAGVSRGVATGATVLARMLVLWIALGILSENLDADRVFRLFSRRHCNRVGLVLGLALNALPHLLSAGRQVWIAHRVRSGTRLRALLHSGKVAEVLLAHTIRIADEAASAAALRGHATLTNPASASLDISAPVIIVTGRSGVGKTVTVDAVVKLLQASNLPVAGVIQPGIFEKGEKVGFNIRDLRSGREMLFARRLSGRSGPFGMRFEFEESGQRLAVQALEGIPSKALVVVDELGPYELRGKGCMRVLQKAINFGSPLLLLLVVRRHLIPTVLSAVSAKDATIIDLGVEGEGAVESICTLIEQRVPGETLIERET